MAVPILSHPADEALHAHRARLGACECPYCVPPERELRAGRGMPAGLLPHSSRDGQAMPVDMTLGMPPYSQFLRRMQ